LVRGRGAPLVFVWVLGTGLFLLVWPDPLFAAAWTALLLALGALTVRDQFKNLALQHHLLRALAGGRVSAAALHDLSAPALRGAVEKSAALFAEIVVKAWDVQRARGEDAALSGAIADADALLLLQLESARQVQEFRRLLALTAAPAARVPAPLPVRAAGPGAAPAPAHRSSPEPAESSLARAEQLHLETVRAIEQEAREAEALVAQIGRQLETLTLQVHQMERRAGDRVSTAQVTHDTSETTARLRRLVEARRLAAEEMVARLGPGAV
jgi:hypothetical protein